MDTKLAVLFYIGIIVPTIITITVFLGFLLCLYKRNLRRKMTKMSRRALPAIPTAPAQSTGVKTRSFDKFDKCSQHSADSAIDVGEAETSMDEKPPADGIVLDARSLGKNSHSYQNEGMQLTAEVEVHKGRRGSDGLSKGYYPSLAKLSEEIHSQVKIYEKMSEVQRVALQLQQRTDSAERHLAAAAMQKPKVDTATTSRYTSTSNLVPGAHITNSNQLNRSNYAAYSPTWYAKEDQRQRTHLYDSQYTPAASSWTPNIAGSCSSHTDNYSSVE